MDKEIFGMTIELVGDNRYIVFDYPINCESEKKLNKKLAAWANEV